MGTLPPAVPTELFDPPPTDAPAIRWTNLLLTAVVVAMSLAALLIPRLIERPLLYFGRDAVMADPDSYMQWRLVRRSIDEGTSRIRWVYDDDAPTGHMNEWTSPMVLVGRAALAMVQIVTGWPFARADTFCRVWLGPGVALMTLVTLAVLGRAAGGWLLAGCWVMVWPLPFMIVGMTRCGSVNHQGLHLLLFTLSLGLCIAGREQAHQSSDPRASVPWWGAALGLANAAAIWAGASELLPVCVLIALLAAWDGTRRDINPQIRHFWRSWWISGLAGTVSAMLFEFGPGSPPGGPGFWHNHLEFISVWDIGLWLLAAGGVELPRFWPVPPRWRMGVWTAGSIILAVVSAATMRHLRISNLHIVQDPRFARLVHAVSEFQPYYKIEPGAFAELGLLPLALLLLIRRRLAGRGAPSPSARTTWVWLGFVAGALLLLMLYEYRWSGYFATALIMLAGYAAASRWPRKPALALAAIAVAILPIWNWEISNISKIASLQGDAMRGPYVSHFGLELACRYAAAGFASLSHFTSSDHNLPEDRRPIVLTSWTWGGYLAGDGKVRVVGSQYWSNLDGFEDTLTLFSTTSDEEFYRLCARRQISLALIPDPQTMMFTIAQACAARTGIWPQQQRILSTALWRLASNPNAPTLPSPGLNQIEPQWRIVQIRR